MRLDPARLLDLESQFGRYLEGEDVRAFLDHFGIHIAAGHWCAGEFFDRFAPGGYNADQPGFDRSEEAQVARIAKAGIEGVEWHEVVFLDAHGGKDPSRVSSIMGAMKEHGIVPTNMNFNTWSNPKYKFGGLTHPDPGVRRDALAQTLLGVEIAKEIGCGSCNIWPGSDGWDYHFEVDYGKRLNWFIEGCAEIARKCDTLGLKFGTEPKQYEPREGNMICNTVAKAALVAQEVNRMVGKTVMGVVIDYGHEQMAGNTPADSLYVLQRFGVPIANFHINGAKYNANDEDRIAGTDDVWRLAEFCYAAADTGYDGWFGLDQFTYRTEQTVSMELSVEFFANCMKKALTIFARREDLQAAQATGDAIRTIQLVKRAIYSG